MFKKNKNQRQINQEKIIEENLKCPICSLNEFSDECLIKPSYGGGGKIICLEHLSENDILSKYCLNCGYIIMFKKFD